MDKAVCHSTPNADIDFCEEDTKLYVFLADQNGMQFNYTEHPCNIFSYNVIKDIHDCLFDKNDNLLVEVNKLFALWMESPLLELQLKNDHRPFLLLRQWDNLLEQFCAPGHTAKQLKRDSPTLTYRRSVFAPIALEQQMQNELVIKLLAAEAMDNVRRGRYPLDDQQAINLAALAVRTNHDSIPEPTSNHLGSLLCDILPARMLNTATGTLTFGRQRTKLIQKIIQQCNQLPPLEQLSASQAQNQLLNTLRSLPVYGAAYFEAQVERPVSKFASLISHPDLKVWVAINMVGLHLVSRKTPEILLSLPHGQFGWEVALPSNMNDPNRLPCVFLHVQSAQSSRADLLQVFTRKAPLIQKLLKQFEKRSGNDQIDAHSISGISTSSSITLTTDQDAALEKLCCASFDSSGQCLRKRGSFTFCKRNTIKSPS